MNRNMKGERLSTEELFELARKVCTEEQIAAIVALHNANLISSKLNEVTKNLRFEMFMRGELILDTRP